MQKLQVGKLLLVYLVQMLNLAVNIGKNGQLSGAKTTEQVLLTTAILLDNMMRMEFMLST